MCPHGDSNPVPRVTWVLGGKRVSHYAKISTGVYGWIMMVHRARYPSLPARAQQKVPCYSTGRLPIIQPLRSYTLTTRWGEAMLVTRVEVGACAPRLVVDRCNRELNRGCPIIGDEVHALGIHDS